MKRDSGLLAVRTWKLLDHFYELVSDSLRVRQFTEAFGRTSIQFSPLEDRPGCPGAVRTLEILTLFLLAVIWRLEWRLAVVKGFSRSSWELSAHFSEPSMAKSSLPSRARAHLDRRYSASETTTIIQSGDVPF